MPPPTGPDREQEEAETILFTGFPGFIGLRLLPRILELRPRARIECLVQEKFLEPAGAAVRAIADAHPRTKGRLGLVRGDITRPGLGLDPGPARDLPGRLREAYHLAAVYDLAVSREVARRINVEGTRNVLEFLQEAPRFSRLHYVSTAYVSGRAKGIFRESDLDVGQGFKNHYEETKFQAEVEVVRSRVPRTIYRPGVVVGDSRTGETGKFDGPYFVLRAMERMPSPGAFIRLGRGRGTVNVVPVDFVVEALARLSTAPMSEGKTYHLTDPDPHSARELSEIFARALGKTFVYVPVPLGLARLLFRPSVVQRFFGMPVEALEYFDDDVRHDATEATRDLGALGVRCPPLEEYVPRLVAFYRSRRDTVRREAMI
ncbi:MAG TPA: SDR family oxidoreductase [Vicinamibacteria bacterium]|nr:SDR family oxidoreductase [Vicinamibacteria bacterium]